MKEGKVVIFQGGGPTAVINWTLVWIVLELWRLGVRHIFGARFGVAGIRSWNVCDFSRYSMESLLHKAATPGAALGSARDTYSDDILQVLIERGITHIIGIGGNDTAETILKLAAAAHAAGYPLVCIHVVKTIDNDLRRNYVTPGHPSAAQHVADKFASLYLDTRAMRRVHVVEVMGRHAGYLTAASALAPVDVILLPECPVVLEQLLAYVGEIYARQKYCLIAMSEGIRDTSGVLMLDRAGGNVDEDPHHNRQLSGSCSLTDWMCGQIKVALKTDQVRGEPLGYAVRACKSTAFDRRIACRVGEAAAQLAINESRTGSVAVINTLSGIDCKLVPLGDVAGKENVRAMSDRYISADGMHVTKPFLDYLRPMVEPMDKIEEML